MCDRSEAVLASARRLERSALEVWKIFELQTTKPLMLLDMTGAAGCRLGIDTDAVGARNHAAGRKVPDRLHEVASDVDGILYRSRLSRSLCVAIYERGVQRAVAGGSPKPLHRAPRSSDALKALSMTLSVDA